MAADQRTVSFRRHLAACVLVLLIGELNLHEFNYKILKSNKENNAAGQVNSYHFTRVKLASALEVVAPREDYSSSGASQTSEQQQQQQQQQVNQIYQHDTDEMSFKNILAQLIAKLNSYLPVINLDYYLVANRTFVNNHLDLEVDSYYNGLFPLNMTLDELQLISVKAAIRMAPIPLHTSWGYASSELLGLGSQPVTDDQLCSQQLAHLAGRLDRALEMGAKQSPPGPPAGGINAADNDQQLPPPPTPPPPPPPPAPASPVDNFEAQLVYKTLDLDLMRLLDSFGRVPSDLLRGNVKWYGSYSSCLDTRLKPYRSAAHLRRAGKTTQQLALSFNYLQQQQENKQSIKFRYCMGAIKSTGWSSFTSSSSPAGHNNNNNRNKSTAEQQLQTNINDGVMTVDETLNNYFIRLGLCLPEACDSSALSKPNNLRHIERLSKFNLARPFNSDHYRLTDLYCLPDERSPLRSIPLMGKLLLAATLGWLSLIALATVVHLNVDKFYTKIVDKIRAQKSSSGGGGGGGQQQQQQAAMNKNNNVNDNEDHSNEFNESDFMHLKLNWIKLNIYLRDRSRALVPGIDPIDCLSLYSNWLRYTKRAKLSIVDEHQSSRLLERRRLRNEQLLSSAKKAAINNRNNSNNPAGQLEIINGGPREEQSGEQRPEEEQRLIREEELQLDELLRRKRVDTSSLNALKVIALVWIIAGHCIFYLGSVISNGAMLKSYLRDVIGFALANGAVYITELFFVITGCLTAYLAFKYNTRVVSGGGGGAGQGDEEEEEEEEEKGQRVGAVNGKRPVGLVGQEDDKHEECQCLLERRVFSGPFWLGIVANRYLRIMPTYLFVYSFIKLVSVYVGGEGPTWDYGVSHNSMRRHCAQESWLPVLTLTSNFVDIYKHCIVGGWYLSVDMQFMLMGVPLLVLLANSQLLAKAGKSLIMSSSSSSATSRRRRNIMTLASNNNNKLELTQVQTNNGSDSKLHQPDSTTATTGAQELQLGGNNNNNNNNNNLVAYADCARISSAYGVIFALGCLSAIVSMYVGVNSHEVDFSFLVRFSPHTVAMLSRNIGMYTNCIFRFRAFAIGLILGHLLYLYEFNLIKLPPLLQRHGTKLTGVIFITGFCVMFMPVLYPKGKIILSHDMAAILAVLCAGSIDIFLSVLIFFICIGKAPKFVLFALNSPFWSLFSSLSLSAFLIHTEVIVVLTSQLDPPPSVSYGILLFVFSATVLLTYSLALGLFLSFEMPMGKLIDSIMRKYLENSRTTDQNKQARAGAKGHEFQVVAGNLKMRTQADDN